jgi:hypothetical protein
MSNSKRFLELLPFALCGLLVAAIAVAATAKADDSSAERPRYVRPAPAPDGRYGKVRGDELIGFKVEDRKVSEFFFNMRMDCHNSETGEDYVRYFDGHRLGGGRAPFNGKYERAYTTESNLRTGSGTIEVNFTRDRGVYASVSVVVPGNVDTPEDCNGFVDLKMRRGPLR